MFQIYKREESKMNDKLAEVLADAIEKSMGAIDKGVEFTLAQAPDLVYQALAWNFTVSLLRMLAWIAVCFVIVKINMIQWRHIKSQCVSIESYLFSQ